MSETKKPRGAPRKENPCHDFARVRCTPEDKIRWNSKAKKLGHTSLASFIRKLLNEAEL